VREIDLETILPYVSGLLSANRNLIGDLLGVRKLLEAEMAADAARAITPERAAKLKSLADQFAADITEGKTGLSADNRFHGYIAELAQNSAMQLINEMCADLLSDTRLATLRVPEHRDKTVQDHMGIYEAIAAGDAALASQRMREHLTRAHAVLQATDQPEA
jgi:GntR family transcriptional regulator, transcriptional repressor for pyruvate dehydrogenase complex